MLDVSGKSSLADVVIIAGAASVRHGQSLADGILELCRQEQFEFLHLEGMAVGEWILADLNDVIVHIFQGPTRELYNLEGLWRDAAVLRDSRPPVPAKTPGRAVDAEMKESPISQ